MPANILFFLLVYMLFTVLFLFGWARWQDRMSQMDADTAKACEEKQRKSRIVSAGVRPYPE